jgi:hypothetical protein
MRRKSSDRSHMKAHFFISHQFKTSCDDVFNQSWAHCWCINNQYSKNGLRKNQNKNKSSMAMQLTNIDLKVLACLIAFANQFLIFTLVSKYSSNYWEPNRLISSVDWMLWRRKIERILAAMNSTWNSQQKLILSRNTSIITNSKSVD